MNDDRDDRGWEDEEDDDTDYDNQGPSFEKIGHKNNGNEKFLARGKKKFKHYRRDTEEGF